MDGDEELVERTTLASPVFTWYIGQDRSGWLQSLSKLPKTR